MKQDFKIYFYHAKGRENSYGMAPITCRIMVGREAHDISTKIFIGPSQWQDNRVKGESEDIVWINNALSEMESRLFSIAEELEAAGEKLTFGRIKEIYKINKPIISRAQYFDGLTTYLRTDLKELAPIKDKAKKKKLNNDKLSAEQVNALNRLTQDTFMDFGCFKQFKKFLRENQLKYSTLKSAKGPVVITCFYRIKLAFSFDPEYDYVAVNQIGDNGYITQSGEFHRRNHSYSFPASTVYKMLTKMIHFEIVSVDIIKSLKF